MKISKVHKEDSLSEENIREFNEAIYKRSYSIVYNEFTAKEKAILLSSLEDNSNKGILEKLFLPKSQLSNYKSILSKKGLVKDESEGVVFALPRFKEFLSFIKAMEEDWASFWDLDVSHAIPSFEF